MKLDDLQKCCVLSNKNGQWYAEGHAIEEEGVVENGYFVSLSQATEYVNQKAEIERLTDICETLLDHHDSMVRAHAIDICTANTFQEIDELRSLLKDAGMESRLERHAFHAMRHVEKTYEENGMALLRDALKNLSEDENGKE